MQVDAESKDESMLHLHLQSQRLVTDSGGHNGWQVVEHIETLASARVCIVVCDMWDRHWSRGAAERVAAMAPRVDETLRAARDRGVWIVHAPSETLDFYAGSPARERMIRLPPVSLPEEIAHPNPPLPIDDGDGGSDTGEPPWYRAWTRQHPAIAIDPERDGITDDGRELYSLLHQERIARVLLLGVHTNMCVLNRSFGIRQLVRWGVSVALVRDLTDAMYNPAMRPYVSHEEGTRLVIEYIEKFWCPTLLSADLSSPTYPRRSE